VLELTLHRDDAASPLKTRQPIRLFLYEIVYGLFEIAHMLVRFNHVVRFIINANDGVV